MKRYEDKILNALLDKYESSLLYTGENKRRQRITYPISEKTLPEYFDLSSMAYDLIHEELSELAAKGFLFLVWKADKSHVLKEVELNTEQVEAVYQALNRTPRSQNEERALKVLQEFAETGDGVTEHVRAWLWDRICAGESVKKYVDIKAPDQILELLSHLHSIAANKDEMYVREFSVLCFHDSKAFEKAEGKYLALIRKFYAGPEEGVSELEDEQLLNLFGIYKNPAYVMVKGEGRLLLSGEGSKIQLEQLSGGIGIHSEDLKSVIFDTSVPVKRVMTVENLTAFHRIRVPGTLLLYLGGYHTAPRRLFLKKVFASYPDAEYRHFGDIDCGGFKILEDLREKTGIEFQPYRMDAETFLEYESYGRALTPNDRRELERMLGQERYRKYREVLELMIQKKKKLEQECVWS